MTLLMLFAERARDDEAADDENKEAETQEERRRRREKERLEHAQRLLQQAMGGGSGTPPAMQRGAISGKVDKYFGTKLPPVCARLGCYVTDDGKRFYCVNPACQKHKKRETKHTRRGRPAKGRFVYFRCPRCSSRSVDMHLINNTYACRSCKYVWAR